MKSGKPSECQREGTRASFHSASPYESFKGSETWKIVEKAVEDLVENNDITETTRRDYIVGYICKELNNL